MTRAALVACLLALHGCGTSSGDDGQPYPCPVGLGFSPTQPVAGEGTTIRVTAHVDAQDVVDYFWRVTFGGQDVTFMPAQDDRSQIDFRAAAPGIYDVSLDALINTHHCGGGMLAVNVRAPGGKRERFRLRIVPPRSFVAPPLEKLVPIDGGADVDLGSTTVDPGDLINPLVTSPDGPLPAYLRFSPYSAQDAIVEAFSDGAGHATARVIPGLYSVLVVPSVATAAPRRIDNWSSSNPMLTVAAGAPITGSVHDPADAPLAGATVQLTIDGVPSTVATTAADGSFALRAAGVGETVVEVTPPAASGLPRLVATSSTFDLGKPFQVRYADSLAVTDLAGTRVLRQGAPVANARVVVVAALAAVGTVTAGPQEAASGAVRIAASADAGGALPAMLVPAAAMSAVITAGPGDLAVAALDTRAGVPASLDAPAMASFVTAVVDVAGKHLPGAVIDAVPVGALAMAAAPTLHVVAGAAGTATAALAAGGHYDLRVRDPAGNGAPIVVGDRTAGTIAASYPLPPAIVVRGTVKYAGGQVLPNAAVQILCDQCSGLERAKPLAEASTDETGTYSLAVPDPGTL